jgi:hypothetical protein
MSVSWALNAVLRFVTTLFGSTPHTTMAMIVSLARDSHQEGRRQRIFHLSTLPRTQFEAHKDKLWVQLLPRKPPKRVLPEKKKKTELLSCSVNASFRCHFCFCITCFRLLTGVKKERHYLKITKHKHTHTQT